MSFLDKLGDSFGKLVTVYETKRAQDAADVVNENERAYIALQQATQDNLQNANANPLTAEQIQDMLDGQSALGINNKTALLVAAGLALFLIVK